MKAINTLTGILCCILLFAATGCDKYENARMTVDMTDIPSPFFTSVNVDITDVQIKYKNEDKGDEGWVSLDTKAGSYDLMDYRNGKTVEIASANSLPVGEVVMIKVRLGNNNTLVTTAGARAELNLPDALQQGVLIDLNTNLRFNQRIRVVLDFNAEDSVVIESDGSYTLSPKIKVISITQV